MPTILSNLLASPLLNSIKDRDSNNNRKERDKDKNKDRDKQKSHHVF